MDEGMRMIKHQILLSSSYSEGTRICLHFTDCDTGTIRDAMDRINSAYGGKRVSFSTHMIHTDSSSWESVVERDPYFDDVRVISDVDEFVRTIQKDRYLEGIDVAKYILSKENCTHTRIEKLTYMCYADYICRTGDRLFSDKVYAFKFGPVVETVYRAFRDYSKEHSGLKIDEKKEYSVDLMLQMRSRILFSEDGDRKLESIDDTLKRYKGTSTDELVDLTHREGSPWYVTYMGRQQPPRRYTVISDENIIRHHHSEE